MNAERGVFCPSSCCEKVRVVFFCDALLNYIFKPSGCEPHLEIVDNTWFKKPHREFLVSAFSAALICFNALKPSLLLFVMRILRGQYYRTYVTVYSVIYIVVMF